MIPVPVPVLNNRALPLLQHAAATPDKIAVWFGGEGWSFSRLARCAQSHAAGLIASGFGRGDTLGIMMSPSPEYIALEYGAFLLGAIVVPVNTAFQGGEVEHLLKSCDVRFLVLDAEFAARIDAGLHARCPDLDRLFVVGVSAPPLRVVMSDAGILQGDAALAPPPVSLGHDDVVLMMCTSATTGKAKGVMLTFGNLQANYDATPDWLHLSAGDVILCALPLYNTFAQNQAINATILLGATMVLLPRFDALDCLRAIAEHGCTFMPAVPTMLQKMLDDPRASAHDLASLRTLCVGAAPVPATLLARLHQRTRGSARVFHAYGLTESTAIVTALEVVAQSSGELKRPKSIGRALPGITVVILQEDGSEAPRNSVGEICIRGPNVMKGYYKAPSATAEALADGWLHTGDLGTCDEEGYFAIVDRKKDLIIRGGQNIYPAEVEEVLYQHPAVAEAVVVALPDEVLGEVPQAFVALKPGAAAAEIELLAHCAALLAKFKRPVAIHFLPELPKGPTGKLLRRALRPTLAEQPA